MIQNKYLFLLFLIVILLILIVYLSVYNFKEHYTPFQEDDSKDLMNPPPATAIVPMPAPGTFKLMDVITSGYFNIDRSNNIAIMDTGDGMQFYLDASSNIISNKNSGAVGLVDYINNNYIENVNGRIEVSDKISINPISTFTTNGPEFGNIKTSWTFCSTPDPFVYNIYNSGGWLNIIKDNNNQPCPYFTNIKRNWMIIGDAQQVYKHAVANIFTLQDKTSGKFLFIDPQLFTSKLNEQATNFVINDNIQNAFYKKFNCYVFQDMYNGNCILPSGNDIISEKFVLNNSKLGWQFFKTDQSNGFIIYNKNNNGWLNANGDDVQFNNDNPTTWILSGTALKYFKAEQPPYLIQDAQTGQFINFNRETDEPILTTNGAYFKNGFINSKDDKSGVYIIDMYSDNYLINYNNLLFTKKFDKNASEMFTWYFIPNNGNQYTIFKMLGNISPDDKNNALYLGYDKNIINVNIDTSGHHRVWNIIYPPNTKMNEPFIGSIEGFGPPLGPMGAMSTASNGAASSSKDSDINKMIGSIPQGPNLSQIPELATAMNMVPGMSPDLLNLQSPSGNDAQKMAQDALNNTFKTIQDKFPDLNKVDNPPTILNHNASILSPLQQFKKPEQMNISHKNYPATNINVINQYINASNSGYITDDKNNILTHPLGSRYFVNTNITCPRKDGTGHTNRYILVDNMKYMKYADGTLNTSNYGLLYSAMGSLQDIDSNTLFTQLGELENVDDPNNKCVNVTIDLNGDKTKYDSKYITVGDCKKIDSIAFKDGDKKICEGFTDNNSKLNRELLLPDANKYIELSQDSVTKFYFGSITIIGLLIFYRMLEKP